MKKWIDENKPWIIAAVVVVLAVVEVVAYVLRFGWR